MYNYYNSYSQCIQPLQLYITVLLCCGALLWQLCCGSSAALLWQLCYGGYAMATMYWQYHSYSSYIRLLWQLCIGSIIVIAATMGGYALAALLWQLNFGSSAKAAMLRWLCYGNYAMAAKATDFLIYITITTIIVITTVTTITTITIIYSCLQPIQRFNATHQNVI